METLRLSLSNIHCESCAETVSRVCSQFFKVIPTDKKPSLTESEHSHHGQAFIRVENNEVEICAFGNEDTAIFGPILKKLIRQISKKGFIILAWEVLRNDVLISSSSMPETDNSQDSDGFFDIMGLYSKYINYTSRKNHIKNCKTCLDARAMKPKSTSAARDSNDSIETAVEKPENEYRAVFSIAGMTCAACASSVSEQIGRTLEENSTTKVPDSSYSVNLLQHTAVVIVPNKHVVNRIVDSIGDAGFEAKLLEVLPVQTSVHQRVSAMIGGMTCAACVNSIQTAVNELPFVLEAGVNVMSKSGQFVLEDLGPNDQNLKKLQETVEDCGFDFELVSSESINYTSSKKKARSINVNIAGMMCNHCPEIIMDYLSSYGEAVVIADPITLKRPFINFTYIPSDDINVRKFLFDLNHLKPYPSDTSSDEFAAKSMEVSPNASYVIDPFSAGKFECTLIEPTSMDDHLRKLSEKEVFNITIRLILATIFAIPTFIFGIVAMSLLPKTNEFRRWVEKPIWAGNVSRNTWILLFLSTPVYFFAADIFHRKAIKEIKNLWLNKNSFRKRLFHFGSMNLLMCLGTTISYVASIVLLILASKQGTDAQMGAGTTYFDSVVFLTFFLLIGRLLESFSKAKTADAISKLSSLKVAEATLVETVEGTYTNDQIVDVNMLEIGDHLRIASGESPPVDCVIVEGSSDFDESALTGESMPVKHTVGHQIFSGTVNTGSSAIVAKIISLDGDSLIDQIVSTVRDGQLRKAPIERTADKLTSYFVPIITFLAVLTWIIWLILGHSGALPNRYLDIDVGGWTVWSLEFSIAVFVIACPCGIGLAAPTALFVGSGLAAKYGILAKGGGVAFQDGASISTICFDKTGTLTNSEIRVTNYHFPVSNPTLKTFAVQITRDLEISSKHPLAGATKTFIDNFAPKFQGVSLSQNKIPKVDTVAGKGLSGSIIVEEGKDDAWNELRPSEAILGNEKLMADYGVNITDHQTQLLNQWKSESKSVILVAIKCERFFGDSDFHLVFMLGARDQIRVEAKKVIQSLQKNNISCWMITGDNKITAEAIAKEIGIKNIVSEVLPDEKSQHVKRIQKSSLGIVAMVGDGINDAPALASADVGIALSSGADLAATSSDFILLNKSHPLIALMTLLELSKAVFTRVKFNFAWSLIYNIIGIPIAAGVIYPYKNTRLSPVWASAAMALSSISVVTSSLALKLFRPKVSVKQCDDLVDPGVEVREDF